MAAKTGRGNTPARAVRVPDDVWDSAKAAAAERGETVSAAVVKFLTRYAKTQDPRAKKPR